MSAQPELSEPISELIEVYRQRLGERGDHDAKTLLERIDRDAELSALVHRLWGASEFAAELCIRHPDWLGTLHDEGEPWSEHSVDYAAALRERLAPFYDLDREEVEARLMPLLRHFQQRELLRIIWRDICGSADMLTTAGRVSELAETILEATLALLHHHAVQRWGRPIGEDSGQPQSMVILGMGKLGAGELNLSSDIDLMFTFPEAGETESAGEEGLSNQQFFLRLGQQLIQVLDSVTRDGFVFRVDMRLRPYGSDGALVCSFEAMENYYQAQGRDWERYALVKARVVAGDREAGADLLERLRPFVYRRYLDFSALESLRQMKIQLNKQVRRKGMRHNIKQGPGGIREVEFVVQALQLVHGGRDSQLRQPSLNRSMQALREGEYLPGEVVDELREAYAFLRDLEHKLQAFANKQTQALPAGEIERARIALAMNYPDWSTLQETLEYHRERVTEHFRSVIHIEEEEETVRQDIEAGELPSLWQEQLDDEAAVALLREFGYEAPEQTWQEIRDFRRQRVFVTLPAESRKRFNRFMPLLLATLAEVDTPSRGFTRVMQMVAAVARRTAYLVLLIENPAALRQFVRLCTASPFIAEFLSHHPVLLDELLDGIDEPPEKAELQEELQQQLLRIEDGNLDAQMELLRYFKQSHMLQVAAAQITGRMTVMKVSDYLTFTAEAVLEQVFALSWDYLVAKHGYPVNKDGEHGDADFAVIGYGKLGGIELSYTSDLDLVFLHNGSLDDDTVAGKGRKAINSREFYTRLAQRMITIMETQTVSGRLYEVDMRLRPSGESGLLVSSLNAFARYQREEAWTWEHQALVRARPLAGSPRLIDAFRQLRAEMLAQPRDRSALAREVLDMRRRMREQLTRKAGRKAREPRFQIKQGRGGIVDVEFIVQFLVLSQSRDCPAMLEYSDNVRILEAAGGCRLLEADDIERLTDASLALRGALHRLALEQDDLGDPLGELESRRQFVADLWDRVFEAYRDREDE